MSYKFTKSPENINHLIYMDDINMFSKKNKIKFEAQIQTIIICNQDIRMEFNLEKCAMFIINSGKRE